MRHRTAETTSGYLQQRAKDKRATDVATYHEASLLQALANAKDENANLTRRLIASEAMSMDGWTMLMDMLSDFPDLLVIAPRDVEGAHFTVGSHAYRIHVLHGLPRLVKWKIGEAPPEFDGDDLDAFNLHEHTIVHDEHHGRLLPLGPFGDLFDWTDMVRVGSFTSVDGAKFLLLDDRHRDNREFPSPNPNGWTMHSTPTTNDPDGPCRVEVFHHGVLAKTFDAATRDDVLKAVQSTFANLGDFGVAEPREERKQFADEENENRATDVATDLDFRGADLPSEEQNESCRADASPAEGWARQDLNLGPGVPNAR